MIDVNLDLADAEIVATAAGKPSTTGLNKDSDHPNNELTLKRQRAFDVNGATAEWHVDQNILVINV